MNHPSGSSHTVTEFTSRSMICLRKFSSSMSPLQNSVNQYIICSFSKTTISSCATTSRFSVARFCFSNSIRRVVRASESAPFSTILMRLEMLFSISRSSCVSAGTRLSFSMSILFCLTAASASSSMTLGVSMVKASSTTALSMKSFFKGVLSQERNLFLVEQV